LGVPPLDPAAVADVESLRAWTTWCEVGGRLRLPSQSTIEVPEAEQALERAAQVEALADWLVTEAYRGPGAAQAEASFTLKLYYWLRPLIPRRAQIAMRRVHARRRSIAFPSWPIEWIFADLLDAYVALRISAERIDGLEAAALWPSGYRCAALLSHDVEGQDGQRRVRELASLESRFEFRSWFNFVPERYPVDDELLAQLTAEGFEVGVHGLNHDGRLFSSREIFASRLPRIQAHGQRWDARGFRSPATHRRFGWMQELPFLYDSSFPDTDPYEPVPGGCLSCWPFSIGRLLELPITMPQDHTLWAILGREAYPIWVEKADWLRQRGGLINLIVHPDYLDRGAHWDEYEAFLEYLRSSGDIWVTVPRELERWWRERRLQAPRETISLRKSGADHEVVARGRVSESASSP
jgi:peptidoglycan/xylan/chitin deacetylase (PgdA/CDA1 family)